MDVLTEIDMLVASGNGGERENTATHKVVCKTRQYVTLFKCATKNKKTVFFIWISSSKWYKICVITAVCLIFLAFQ